MRARAGDTNGPLRARAHGFAAAAAVWRQQVQARVSLQHPPKLSGGRKGACLAGWCGSRVHARACIRIAAGAAAPDAAAKQRTAERFKSRHAAPFSLMLLLLLLPRQLLLLLLLLLLPRLLMMIMVMMVMVIVMLVVVVVVVVGIAVPVRGIRTRQRRHRRRRRRRVRLPDQHQPRRRRPLPRPLSAALRTRAPREVEDVARAAALTQPDDALGAEQAWRGGRWWGA
jgi:hypothetical protein